jgi:hypothetical protein
MVNLGSLERRTQQGNGGRSKATSTVAWRLSLLFFELNVKDIYA